MTKYPSPDEAARQSKSRMAVSPPYTQTTPRGPLPCVLIKPLGRDGWWAYASSHGIKVPPTYAPCTSADIDKVRDWTPY